MQLQLQCPAKKLHCLSHQSQSMLQWCTLLHRHSNDSERMPAPDRVYTSAFNFRLTSLLHADFIYSEYASTLGSHGNSYRQMVWQIAEDYACANVLLRLPGYSPMPAFGEVLDVPLVVRHAQRSKTQVHLLLE